MVAMVPTTRREDDLAFRINRKQYPLATSEQLRQLSAKRSLDVVSGSAQDSPLGQPFALHGDFRHGYGFTFTPGFKGYESATGWDASAPGKIGTWPRHAALESVADVNYRGWWYYDYATGYLYLFRGRYSVKYAPDDSGSQWSILEYHVFGTSGEVVCGQPALFKGKVYVPLATAATGALLRWHELTTIATPVTETQTIAISGTPTGGTYTISFNDGLNTYTTTALAYNASGADVQAALRALPGLAKVTVSTAGSTPDFTHTVTMTAAPGALSAASAPQFTSTDNTTGGAHAITHATTVAGTTDTWTRGPASYEASYFTVWNKSTVGPVLVRANGSTVSMASTTPTTGANWSTAQQVDDTSFKITALATVGRLLFVGKENGLFSFDESAIVVNELPSISSVVDANNFVGMKVHNSYLYAPHKLGLIRWKPGAPWQIVGAEEDDELDGDRSPGWGQVMGLAPYGKIGYVSISNAYDGDGAVVSLQQLRAGERGPITPQMHHQLLPVEDLAIAQLKQQPIAAVPAATLTDNNAVGTLTWSNPENAGLDDSSYAQAGGAAGQTHYLKGVGLNLNVNGSATILGITARVARYKSLQSITTSATSPGTGGNLASVGTNAWTNPGNITASDNSYATCATAGTTQGLRASNFGFSIPTVASILGVQVDVERKQTAGVASYASSTVYPGTAANDASAGVTAWSSPTAIQNHAPTDPSGTYAYFNGYYGESQYLKCTGFSLNVPNGKTILGVVVTVNCSVVGYPGSATAYLSEAKIVKGGTIGGSNNANGTHWTTSLNYGYGLTPWSTISNGGAADLWGNTLTAADVNASNFGVALRAYASGSAYGDARIQSVTMTVYYEDAADVIDYSVRLVDDGGSATGANKASASAWPTSDGVASYGGAADTWSATLTPAVVNDTDFGAFVAATVPTSGTAYVDQITIAVTYQVADVVDTVVKIVKGGAVTGNNLADTSTQWPSSETIATYGSSTNLWGTTLTPSDVNAADFGFVISATVTSGGYARVQYVTIEITVSIPGVANPASYLVVCQVSADGLTANPVAYKLPRSGLTVSNDPQIAKHVTLGATFTSGRVYGPSRATVKRYMSVEGWLDLEAAATSGLYPGVRIEAQIEDSGVWVPLIDYDGQDELYEPGPFELYFPDAVAAGRWVQLRAVIDAAGTGEVGVAVTIRDLTLRGFVLSEPTDESHVVLVLGPNQQQDTGQASGDRGSRQMVAELQGYLGPPDRTSGRQVIEVHDPVLHRTVPAIVTALGLSEFHFRGTAESVMVAVVKYQRVRAPRRTR